MDVFASFYEQMKSGLEVSEFLGCHAALFREIKAHGLMEDYRLGRGRMKRLRDEVTPVALFLPEHADSSDKVQFPLNNNVPDCNVWHRTPNLHRTIEVTVAQARERLNLMTELNETGWGRGFIGVTDDKPKSAFDERMAEPREAYSTDRVREIMTGALILCAGNKAHSQGHTLIISAAMDMLPRERWIEMRQSLAAPVSQLAFQEVYLVGRPDEKELCLRLK
ncbi:hypothetical protein [Bradyrhizobium sp.]|uniref:hypothetical protein n=1 Tax=Bradyrhizobium sp. TaxID=376 RepID=UPI001ECBA8B2|nr:hypothetical protein [Bradyrhizobium sp.]MBV8891617.1 hypothetical protein [Acidobacteriota bacterium]MBV9481897.1 hypothetical protein [Acidobacteriota bacterium]MBV9978957.1 hypothetical protein [Bradyrhizobium sp.]